MNLNGDHEEIRKRANSCTKVLVLAIVLLCLAYLKFPVINLGIDTKLWPFCETGRISAHSNLFELHQHWKAFYCCLKFLKGKQRCFGVIMDKFCFRN